MGFFLDIYIVYFARSLWRLIDLLRSHRWSKSTATILGVHVRSGLYDSVAIDYEYGAPPKYASTFVKPFIFESSAKAYAQPLTRGMQLHIRIKPRHPEVSVAD
jgi:hypothetical protein